MFEIHSCIPDYVEDATTLKMSRIDTQITEIYR
jgi:hypothetical protein